MCREVATSTPSFLLLANLSALRTMHSRVLAKPLEPFHRHRPLTALD